MASSAGGKQKPKKFADVTETDQHTTQNEDAYRNGAELPSNPGNLSDKEVGNFELLIKS